MNNDQNPKLEALAPESLGVEPDLHVIAPGPRGRLPFDWNSVDWTRSNHEIAAFSGMSYLTVSAKRRSLGLPPTRSWWHSKYSDYPWDSLDWSQSNNELSRQTGIPIGSVRRYRMTHNKPKPSYSAYNRGSKVKITEEMIQNADWKYCRDQDLAMKWGVSRERVRQLRQFHGKPKCDFKNLTGKILECLRWIDKNKSEIEGRHLDEVLPLLPAGTRQVRLRAIRKSGVNIDWTYSAPHCNPHVRTVNWDLPNTALAFIWTSFSRNNGIPSARSRFGKCRANWDIRFGKRLSVDLLQAISAEVAKAKAAGVVPDEAGLNEWIKGKE